MPNLRGASPVGRDEGGYLNAARTDSSSGSRQRRRVRGTPRSDEDEDQVVDEGQVPLSGRWRTRAGKVPGGRRFQMCSLEMSKDNRD